MKVKKIIVIIVCVLAGLLLAGIVAFFPLGLLMYSVGSAEVIETVKLSEYQNVIGENADEEYNNKWGMSEEIFPSDISDLNVEEFKMVYYNPWDAQYLSYLVVDYADDISGEIDRLSKIENTEYLGYYGVYGFADKYELLAMNADSYQGFVYAIHEKDTGRIIYVELIFCNYMFELDYEDYIKTEYLPLGFDATEDNDYRNEKLK